MAMVMTDPRQADNPIILVNEAFSQLTGYGCDEGVSGACADEAERFAESFAKWALGDIGVNLEIGYKVPPPSAPLDVWGAPLARLAASA